MKKSIIFLFLKLCLPLFLSNNAGFSLDTLVQTPMGAQKLGELQVGDKVSCCDSNNALVTSRIMALADVLEEVFELVLADATTLYSSAEQQFFIANKSRYVAACYLCTGDTLLQKDGSEVEIVAIKKMPYKKVMRSITVEKHHNFFVSEHGVLAHNIVFTIPILVWGGGLAMTWFEGITVATVGTAVLGVVAKKVLQKGVKKATGKDIGGLLDVGEKICQGAVHNLQHNAPQPVHLSNTEHTIAVVSSCEIQSPDITSCITCPGREVSPPLEIIHQGPSVYEVPIFDREGYDIVPPEIKVCPGPEIVQPEKGSNITDIEPVLLHNQPIIVTKTIQDILDESEPFQETNKSAQFSYPGSYEDAQQHFDDFELSELREIGSGKKMGYLPNGDKVILRPAGSDHKDKSGGGLPTLEVQTPGVKKKIKIRYNQETKENNGS